LIPLSFYFPAYNVKPQIKNPYWKPIRVIDDKIYYVEVGFEAYSSAPINYVELKLTLIEYRYMIEEYGMKEEDYSLANLFFLI